MKAELLYVDGLAFEATHRAHRVMIDSREPALGGKDRGPTPKELLLSAILGCSGIDIAAYLKKHRLKPDVFKLEAGAENTDTHPRVFKQVDLVFEFKGEGLPVDTLREAVELSMTKYCGVSAMVSKVSPIHYSVVLNGDVVHRGQAKFW